MELSQQLKDFFAQWQDLPKSGPEQLLADPVQFNAEGFNHFIQNYMEAKKPVDAARELGFLTNIWQVAGLGNDEVRNSRVLKWLLDWRSDHGQTQKILNQFLQLLPKPFSQLTVQDYQTTAECCPLGEQDSRVDIEIDAENLLLFIEIKINANEGVDQLQRYQQIAQAKAKDRPWLVVYLTRTGILPPKYKSQNGFIALSWEQVARMLKNYVKTAHADNRAAWLINQFASHINTF